MPNDNTTGLVSLNEALTAYRSVHLASRNFAERTRREYTSDLTDLVAFLEGSCQVSRVAQVGTPQLEAYLAELDRRGLMGSSRRRKVASIRSFFAFLLDQDAIVSDPARRLVPPEREHLQPRVLTEAEYKRLQLAVAHQTRDAALIELVLQTGMRLSELARMTVGDLELPAKITKEVDHVGIVRILGKGRKSRTITLNWKACRALSSYLRVRPTVDDPRFFVSKFGHGLSSRAIEYLTAKYLAEAGITGASVHSLRHTFATQHVKRGTKLDVVRQALGHADLKTTAIYIGLAREVMDKELQENAL
jgi:integrase/recombinase XerD